MSAPLNARVISYNIFTRIDNLAFKYIKHQTIGTLVANLIRPRIQNLILKEIPENELKQILQDCFTELEPFFTNMQKGKMIIESRTLNTNEKGELSQAQKFIEKNLESYAGVFD